MKLTRACMNYAAGTVLLVFSTSCAVNPITNKPIADSFAGCMALNTGVAAVAGLLAAKAAKSKAAGGATAGVTLLIAWHQCAQAHQKLENIEVKSREQIQPEGAVLAKQVRIDQFKLTVGAPGEDINSVVRYIVLSDDPAKKDIPVKETRVIQVPKTVQDAGRLYFADAKDQPLLDAKGRPIPADGKTRYDPDALVYDDVPISVENVVKQGMRKADGQLPSIPELSDNLPYRMKFIVEAEGMRAEKELDFRFRKPGTGVATYEAKIDVAEAPARPRAVGAAPAVTRVSAVSAQDASLRPDPLSGQRGICVRRVALLHLPGGSKKVAKIPAGSRLTILETETMQSGAKGLKGEEWLKVRSETGETGWIRKAYFRGQK